MLFCKFLCEHLQYIVAMNSPVPAKFYQLIGSTGLRHQASIQQKTIHVLREVQGYRERLTKRKP